MKGKEEFFWQIELLLLNLLPTTGVEAATHRGKITLSAFHAKLEFLLRVICFYSMCSTDVGEPYKTTYWLLKDVFFGGLRIKNILPAHSLRILICFSEKEFKLCIHKTSFLKEKSDLECMVNWDWILITFSWFRHTWIFQWECWFECTACIESIYFISSWHGRL